MEVNYVVPGDYLSVVSYYCRVRNPIVADTIVFTNEGELITFDKRTVRSRCYVGIDIRISEIIQFSTYEPYREYFLLICNNDDADGRVIVVEHEVTRSIICDTFENVRKIDIVDDFNVGRPQLKFTFNHSSICSKIITDFRRNSTEINAVNTNTSSSSKVVLSGLRLDAFLAEKRLQKKRIVRKTLINTFLNRPCDRLYNKLLTIKLLRKKLYNDRWCVFYAVRNSSNYLLTNARVSLIIIGLIARFVRYRVKLFLFKRWCELKKNRYFNTIITGGNSKNIVDDNGPTSCPVESFLFEPRTEYLLAISFSSYRNDVVRRGLLPVYFAITYDLNRFERDFIDTDRFYLNATDLNDPNCIAINDDDCFDSRIFDVLTVVSTSNRRSPYKLFTGQRLYDDLESILYAYGFRKLRGYRNYFLIRPSSTIAGAISIDARRLNTFAWLLKIYTVNRRDEINFLTYLNDNLPTSAEIKHGYDYDNDDDKYVLLNKIENRLKLLTKTVSNDGRK